MRILFAVLLLAAGSGWSAPALAQNAIEGRVDRLEREMRAVQRKVFPGGAGRIVTPDITAPVPDATAPGIPATSAVANLQTRITSLEQQLATLTGQIEEGQYRIRQLEEAFNAYRSATDAKLNAYQGSAPAGGLGGAPAEENAGAAPPRISADTASAAADPARAEAVEAVERPESGDPVEDQYVYGFRLWQAKLYPEAQAALKQVVEKNPDHRRASFAQNLLGRAYLDDGKPSLASIAFYENYKKMPDGERAPDSLYYLAQALVQLDKQSEACQVYAELSDVYGDRISAALKEDIAEGRGTAKCS